MPRIVHCREAACNFCRGVERTAMDTAIVAAINEATVAIDDESTETEDSQRAIAEVVTVLSVDNRPRTPLQNEAVDWLHARLKPDGLTSNGHAND